LSELIRNPTKLSSQHPAAINSTHHLDQLPSIFLAFVTFVNPHSFYTTAAKASKPVKMLRRPATTIQLTQADIEAYEANRQRRLWEMQQAQSSQASAQSSQNSEKSQQIPQKSKNDRVMGGRLG
jgi:hypothetical protein